jgi:hypothetical protein
LLQFNIPVVLVGFKYKLDLLHDVGWGTPAHLHERRQNDCLSRRVALVHYFLNHVKLFLVALAWLIGDKVPELT